MYAYIYLDMTGTTHSCGKIRAIDSTALGDVNNAAATPSN